MYIKYGYVLVIPGPIYNKIRKMIYNFISFLCFRLTVHSNLYWLLQIFLGKRFASGAADKTVIIWTSKLEGILKYT